MATTRKKREAQRDELGKIFAFLLIGGVVILILTSYKLLGVLLVVAALGLLYSVWVKARRRKQALLNLGVEDLDALGWEEFEELLVVLFQWQGYQARLTPNGADFGADLVIEKNGKKTVVQAKHWPRKDVGVKPIQEIVAAAGHYEATGKMAITSGYFTKPALELSTSNKVELWDRDKLLRELATVGRVGDAPLSVEVPALTPSPQPEPVVLAASPGCPRCGSQMVERVGKRGAFWGCSAFPRCRGTRPITGE